MTALQTPLDGSPPESVTAPPLSREAARAVIARRLRALDHRPDLLDNQAIAALIDHAGGSGMRLRAALAATLFLASTEDAPRIGRSLVQRALLESGDIQPAPAAASPPAWRRLLVPGGAVLACTALAVAFLTLRPSNRAEPTQQAAAPAQVSVPPAAVVQADRAAPAENPAMSPAPAPPAAASQPPAPQQAAAPLPAPASVTAQPLTAAPSPPVTEPPSAPAPAPVTAPVAETAPSADTPAPAPPDLPAAPTATVVLMVSARDPSAAQRLDALMQHMRAAGIGQIVTRPATAARARRPVSYFFADDLPLAQRITQLLANEGWPHLTGNSLTPRLVIPPPGLPPRPPGLIEIQLP